MRKYFAAIVVIGLCTAPLSAELKVTSKMVARQVAGAPAGNDMMAAMVGPMITQMYGGADGVDMTVTMHEDGRMRTDYPKGFAGMPAGAVVILRADGSSVGFDDKVATKRTGEFATIAGLKAERVSMTMVMAVPLPPGAENMPPEMMAMIPKEIKVEGDNWVAQAHAKYMKTMTKVTPQATMASCLPSPCRSI